MISESFEVLSKFLKNAEDDDYDNFVRRFKNPLVKKLGESGKSVLKSPWLMRRIFPVT